MTKIKLYAADSVIHADDKVIGTDGVTGANNGRTKNYPITDLADWINDQYVLPISTSSVLGGVKIGDNVTVTGDGTISVASPSPFEKVVSSGGVIRRDRNESLYGDVGVNAIDFSISSSGSTNGATGNNSFAVGSNAVASASGSVAIGSSANASGSNCFSLGSGSVASTGNSFAFGNDAEATNVSAIAIGTSRSSGNSSVAIATGTSNGATALRAIAMSSSALASATDAIAIGQGSEASAVNAVSVGTSSEASGTASIAIGNQATTTHSQAVAIGQSSETTSNQQIALGPVDASFSILIASLPNTTSYADDTAAAAGGVLVGELYRTGSVVKVRVS